MNGQPKLDISDDLSRTKDEILNKYPHIIFKDEKTATQTKRVQCKLYLKHDRPIRMGIRALGHHKRTWLQKEIDELMKAKVIRPSKSEYAAAPTIVDKKDGT
jgi:hypothetical protein